ncbi:nuclear transcription factor Y subunit gamma-like isoform X2 [Gigantopelta aegis]|uniref:nuclear transcription factor Y subunit gamma-like isoform X2 n=1 Tax=Gigantopelta aegis TaxID=1735272 RepID=UPI001B88BEC2|nr:nuclear transcription factor Y subunit gamma-like isoform X2 [Gigantopelta aegis]
MFIKEEVEITHSTMSTSTGDLAFQASGVSDQAQQMLQEFWPKGLDTIKNLTSNDFKSQELPLARIKKIMKLDEDVKMISAEAPVLFAKAAEIFISELSLRAWIHTEDNKRRTLQRNDIAMAISKYDQFDFLIDIVPRDELKPPKRSDDNRVATSSIPDQIQYYLQMAQQQSQQQQQQTTLQPTVVTTPQAVVQQQPAQAAAQPQVSSIQLSTGQIIQQPFQVQAAVTTAQPQVIQVQAPQVQQIQQPVQAQVQQVQAQPVGQTTQVYQQVVTPSGQIQNIPIQLTASQLQAIQMQLQGKQTGGNQSIVIQTNQAAPATETINITEQNLQTFQAQPMYQVQQIPGIQGAQQIFIQQPAGSGETENQSENQEAS